MTKIDELMKLAQYGDLFTLRHALEAALKPNNPCQVCGSDCNERDELAKAEREIERLRAALKPGCEPIGYRYKFLNFMGQEVWSFDPPRDGNVLETVPVYTAAPPAQPDVVRSEWLEHAFREGWGKCRDAEFVGEEAEDWAFGSSTANSRMLDAQQAPPAQTGTEDGISRDEWIDSAIRIYMAAGDSEEVALRCAAYLWGELDMEDIPCPYDAALSDVEGREQAGTYDRND